MDEEEKKKPEENKQEVTDGDSDKGDKSQSSTLVDDTNLASKRLEEATKEAKEERLAREESYSKMKLGGGSEGGQVAEKKEETPKEYNDRIDKEISEGKHNE